ncbi:hypothetical protein [Spirosoma fluviale]|uniref:Por secretion system C-terminal sorting domain-containing protein n=1 Tax=Spirosoma fluviale TaxID=1597977 RepID=A0A286GLF8_9BACT|nr:hypothetical protein [Spirosoma fluviale]SOD96332.1 hypothetical protein SAMN06269250_5255 [Spirosoma fluviale]
MKTLAQSLLTALLLSTATLATAESANPISTGSSIVTTNSYKAAIFPSTIPSKLNVYVERTPGQLMSVSFKSTDGAVLEKLSIGKKQGNFHFLFDISDLKDGTYTIEIMSGSDVSEHSVTLATPSYKSVTRTIALN